MKLTHLGCDKIADFVVDVLKSHGISVERTVISDGLHTFEIESSDIEQGFLLETKDAETICESLINYGALETMMGNKEIEKDIRKLYVKICKSSSQ